MNLLYNLLGISTAYAEAAPTAQVVAPEAVATAVIEAGVDATPIATEMAEEVSCLTGCVGMLPTFFPIILMVVIMYFLMIRPEKKRKKKEQAMLNALKRGDRICTIGGIYGTIADIKDDTVTLSVGRDNLTMVVARWSIRSVEDVTIENETEALN